VSFPIKAGGRHLVRRLPRGARRARFLMCAISSTNLAGAVTRRQARGVLCAPLKTVEKVVTRGPELDNTGTQQR
jgi:hypothetical protein